MKLKRNSNNVKLNKELKLKNLKKCSNCEKVKDLKDFTFKNKEKNIYRTNCRECDKLLNTQHEKKYRNTTKKLKTYNLSQDELDILMEKEQCEICNERVEGKNKHIDHCHKSQFVRGILCHRCNLGLGHFKDNEMRLFSAIAYLRKANTLKESLY